MQQNPKVNEVIRLKWETDNSKIVVAKFQCIELGRSTEKRRVKQYFKSTRQTDFTQQHNIHSFQAHIEHFPG